MCAPTDGIDNKLMKALLDDLLDKQRALLKGMEDRFAEYFSTVHLPEMPTADEVRKGDISVRVIARPDDNARTVDDAIARLTCGAGLYVLMTDYAILGADVCTFMSGKTPLRAIYRGHSSNVKERVMSHLTTNAYLAMCDSKKGKKPWGAYMRISDDASYRDGNKDGGINITQAPYAGHTWAVAVFDMPGSTRLLRERAENGFGKCFGVPVRSSKEPVTRIAEVFVLESV